MLKNEIGSVFEKRFSSWYLTKQSEGKVYVSSTRKWLLEIQDDTFNSVRESLLLAKEVSRIDLYNRLELMNQLFNGQDLDSDGEIFYKIFWDFQVYTIFDDVTGAPYGVFLVTENSIDKEREDALESLTGFDLDQIEDRIYALK